MISVWKDGRKSHGKLSVKFQDNIQDLNGYRSKDGIEKWGLGDPGVWQCWEKDESKKPKPESELLGDGFTNLASMISKMEGIFLFGKSQRGSFSNMLSFPYPREETYLEEYIWKIQTQTWLSWAQEWDGSLCEDHGKER